jgi:hypothetical protein
MRFYVRRANYPIFEGPVTISGPDKQVGTFVFTALNYTPGGEMRWNVVSMYKNPADIEPVAQGQRAAAASTRASVPAADVAAAKAALDRISLPDEATELISDTLLPGASLIISDEGPSIETGKDTDFVIVMSGEPQGGIKIRQRQPTPRNNDFYGNSPFWFKW